MLQSIRDRSQGWFAWVIIGLVILAFALWGLQRFLSNWSGQTKVMAKVNGQEITIKQFNLAYERLKRQLELQNTDGFGVTPVMEILLKRKAFKMLIVNTILTQAANKIGYSITPEQIETVIMSMPLFQVNKHFSIDRYRGVLNTLMYTEADFVDQLRTDMLLNQLQLGYVTSAFALPQDVDTTYRFVNQKRNFQFYIIPSAQFNKDVQVSESSIKAFYEKNQEKFKMPQQVSVEYVVISLPEIIAKIKPDEQTLQHYYQQNLSSFTQPPQWHIAHILIAAPKDAAANKIAQANAHLKEVQAKLAQGEDFGKLAKSYSNDNVSAKNNGLLPWFMSGQLGLEVQNVIEPMKIGQVSPKIIRTNHGFEIIKLIEKKPERVLAFSDVRKQIQATYIQEQAQRRFAELSEQLANLTYANSDSLKIASDKLQLPIKTSELFLRVGTKTGITKEPKVVSAAFSQNVLSGENSDVIQIDPQTQLVLRIKQNIPATVKPYDSVRSAILEQLTKDKAREKAEQYGQSLLKQLATGLEPSALANKEKFKWQINNNILRLNKDVNTFALYEAFRLPPPKNQQKFTYKGITTPTGDYMLLLVTNIMDGLSSSMTDSERKNYQHQLANNFGRLDFELYVKQQMMKAKVKTNNKVVKEQFS
ncbi:MAG: SurA N-terminal domain-containing protein [Gammaproteobacteria bacterium]